MAIQRFIKCKGGTAFICRVHWREGKAPKCYVVSNKVGYKDEEGGYVVEWSGGVSIVEGKGGTGYGDPAETTGRVAGFVGANIGVRFSDMVADYIR